MRCAVLNCNSAKTASDKNSQLCFFKFPKNADLAKQWLSFCGNKDALNMKNASVCMKHFKDDDIVGALKFELGLAKKRTLRPGAVPCIQLESESMSEKARKERNQKRENQKLVAELLADAEVKPDDIEPTPSYVRYNTGIASAPAFVTPPKIEINSFVDEDDPLSGDAKQAYLKTQFIKCRTCYRDFELDAGCEDPFDNTNSVLLFRIEVICGVWLSNIEGGPRYICPDCVLCLNTAIDFRERVISTEVMLTQGMPVCDKPELVTTEPEEPLGNSVAEWSPIGMAEDDGEHDILDDSYSPIESPNKIDKIEILESIEEDANKAPADPLSVARGAKILDELISEFTGNDKPKTERSKKETPAAKPAKAKAKEQHKKTTIRPTRQANPKSQIERNRIRRAQLRKKPPSHVCDQCGQVFRMTHNLQIHMLRHTRTKNFHCPECPMTFYDAYMRNIHIRVRHKGELPYVCRYCPERFAYAGKRQLHEGKVHWAAPRQKWNRINSAPKKRAPTRHFCQLCDKSYISKYALAWHVKSHEDANAFKCQQCDKSYSEPAKLRRHELTHQEKPLQCDVCLKGFYQRCKLKDHELIHTGERPHRCEICNVNFRYKTNLKVHANTKMHQDNLEKAKNSVQVYTD
ncbi:zinc finger protein 62 homolog isoform X3 [Drosophila subobscura]|uniref:zinc finger protein 62 homolog isoform X3 n=1 Tax=Drosophila subobscura TaxID=7241 RepID=UPI00155AC74B|nr:zinc finger protein 62 homolog isoform X3 [Drosophila subobscura]